MNGQRNFERIAAEAQKLGIPGLQFEARLAEGEEALLRGDKNTAQSRLTALERDADRRGFRQFAVRARNLAASAAVKAG